MALIKGGSRRSRRGPFQFPAGTLLNGKSVGGRFASAAQAEIILRAKEDPAALAAAGLELEAEIKAGLRVIAERAVQKARAKAPSRTGALRQSISAQVTGDTITISATVPYAKYQERGSNGPIYMPVPTRGGKAIRVFQPGTYEYPPGEAYRSFMHPGFDAQNFMSDTLDEIADEAGEILAIMLS